MMKNLLIIGAGEGGRMVAREIRSHGKMAERYRLLGFLDDDSEKKKADGIVILGGIDEAANIIERYQISEVIIAIPSAGPEVINRILSNLPQDKVDIKIIPGLYEIIGGSFSLRYLRRIEATDLLGREEVGFDKDELANFYVEKKILVTGAGGSIGSEIVRQLLSLPVKNVIALGHGENSIYTLKSEVGRDSRFLYQIADIRDSLKMRHVMEKHTPDIVFHAAAHKHVPLMEEFPDEAIKNNVLGTYRSAMAAVHAGVKRFVLVSTDKAVNPSSVMGATKRLAERLILSLNQKNKTRFTLTRFGNVMGSRGSVIPLFEQQIRQGGPVTVTHPDITRYFMSIREAARLVIKSATIPEGHIFVLDMGKPIRILDLAREMIRLSGYSDEEIPIVFTGLRPGEKLHEELLSERESLSHSNFDKIMISRETEETFAKDTLPAVMAELEEAADALNRENLIKLLRRKIPNFHRIQA